MILGYIFEKNRNILKECVSYFLSVEGKHMVIRKMTQLMTDKKTNKLLSVSLICIRKRLNSQTYIKKRIRLANTQVTYNHTCKK